MPGPETTQQREALQQYGMTDTEIDIWFALAEVAGRTLQLPTLHRNEQQETVLDFHSLQSRLLARPGLRAMGWQEQPANPGSRTNHTI